MTQQEEFEKDVNDFLDYFVEFKKIIYKKQNYSNDEVISLFKIFMNYNE